MALPVVAPVVTPRPECLQAIVTALQNEVESLQKIRQKDLSRLEAEVELKKNEVEKSEIRHQENAEALKAAHKECLRVCVCGCWGVASVS